MTEINWNLELRVWIDEHIEYRLMNFDGQYVIYRNDYRLHNQEYTTAAEWFDNKYDAENTLSSWVSEERANRSYT